MSRDGQGHDGSARALTAPVLGVPAIAHAWSERALRRHSLPALAAAATGVVAAFLAGSASVLLTTIALTALLIGYGRSPGWRLSALLDRPRLFSIVSAIYVPFFPIDLLLSVRTEPISALVRLIVFLLVVEALSGTAERAHRPLLFGLLLLMSAAAETTDVWFAIPLVVFGFAAVATQIRWTLHAEEPAGASLGGDADLPARGVLPIVAGSLVLGSIFFFLIPRVGAGLGRRPSSGSGETRIETGLAEQVSLNTLGRVKRRSTPVFRARILQAESGSSVDPDSIYWRAMTYSRWTGSGWAREEDDFVRLLRLQSGERTAVPGEAPGERTASARKGPGEAQGEAPRGVPGADPSIVAEIERLRAGMDALLSPGLPLWIRSPRQSVLVVSSDGTFRAARGTMPPRTYEVAARVVRPRRHLEPRPGKGQAHRFEDRLSDEVALSAAAHEDRRRALDARAPTNEARFLPEEDQGASDEIHGAPDIATPSEASASLAEVHARGGNHSRPEDRRARVRSLGRFLDARPADETVARWAASIAPGETSAVELARAFERDLSKRQYSLDTTAIDPLRPIASFLGGAPGHCEYFASAMALGLRLRGVPARVVGGYLGADTIPFSSDLVVRESRAHLWVEVHLPEEGWTLFDPTPAAGRYLTAGRWPAMRALWDRTAMAWDSTIVGLDLNDQLDAVLVARERAARLGATLLSAAPALVAAAAGAAVVSVLLVLLRRRRIALGLGVGANGWPAPPKFYRRLLALAARRGIVPAPSETASEFGRRAGAALGDPAAVSSVSALYERARFGGLPISPSEVSGAEAVLARLRRARRSQA